MIVVVLMVSCAVHVLALKCYMSDPEGKTRTLEENPRWRYCVYSQSLPVVLTSGKPIVVHSEPAHFGLGNEEENLSVYDNFFGTDDDYYTVLSNCVLEKVNLSGNHKFSEYMFRCLCRTDGCNRGSNIRQHIKYVTDQSVQQAISAKI